MANFVTNAFRNGILGSHATRVDLDADTIKPFFVDAADDVPLVTDDFLDDILSAGRVPAIGSAPALASKTIGTVAVGVFDAADAVFTALTGDQVEWLVLAKSTGADATSDLICAWDTITGLPLTPNGADVTLVFAAGGILTA
ncbi:hypothetical protein BH23CHL8_BH23CHL8_30490 [soil metagenome]